MVTDGAGSVYLNLVQFIPRVAKKTFVSMSHYINISRTCHNAFVSSEYDGLVVVQPLFNKTGRRLKTRDSALDSRWVTRNIYLSINCSWMKQRQGF